mmetsp:Transcript_9152/g.41635  ORF Transcript_9152/g.41635 Transcript_9152/m.41635 type:complete len:240 (+) Transcript_9152:111-830(+)
MITVSSRLGSASVLGPAARVLILIPSRQSLRPSETFRAKVPPARVHPPRVLRLPFRLPCFVARAYRSRRRPWQRVPPERVLRRRSQKLRPGTERPGQLDVPAGRRHLCRVHRVVVQRRALFRGIAQAVVHVHGPVVWVRGFWNVFRGNRLVFRVVHRKRLALPKELLVALKPGVAPDVRDARARFRLVLLVLLRDGVPEHVLDRRERFFIRSAVAVHGFRVDSSGHPSGHPRVFIIQGG